MRAGRTITYDGITLTIKEWAKRTNLNEVTLRKRLAAGWTIEQCFTLPLDPRGRECAVRKEITKRLDRKLRTKAVHIQREFGKLVSELDDALRTFSEKLDTLLSDEDTPGVVEQPANDRPDRTIPSAQETT